MNRNKQRLRRRKRILICVFFVALAAAIWYAYLTKNVKIVDQLELAEEIVGMTLSALISTFIAIWLTRKDIMEDDFLEKKEKFGVIAFEEGYKKFIESGDSESYLHIHTWEEFLVKENRDKEIDIVGVALKGFFSDENSSLPKKILMLCIKEGYNVNVILANPYSEEVMIQSIGQYKDRSTHIADRIMGTRQIFISEISELDKQYEHGNISCSKKPSEIIKDKFRILFSNSMPKAFIVRAGIYMLITPYQMKPEGPSASPTMIVKNANASAFYDQYLNYINRLKDMSTYFESLQAHVAAESFFDQPYGDELSQEFINDLQTCSTLDILGLGQNKMYTRLEHEMIKVLGRGGNIRSITSKPDGMSTEMCVSRSLIHENLDTAILEHKCAINLLMTIRDKYAIDKEQIKVYTWDCFFPYTMYAFNLEDTRKAKIYIWITNLFGYSNERDGFVIDGKFEPEYVKKYQHQYEQVLEAAVKSGGEIKESLTLE